MGSYKVLHLHKDRIVCTQYLHNCTLLYGTLALASNQVKNLGGSIKCPRSDGSWNQVALVVLIPSILRGVNIYFYYSGLANAIKEETVSAPERPWIASMSGAMSLWTAVVAFMSMTARSLIGEDIIIVISLQWL